jgi:hypothetical protein
VNARMESKYLHVHLLRAQWTHDPCPRLSRHHARFC